MEKKTEKLNFVENEWQRFTGRKILVSGNFFEMSGKYLLEARFSCPVIFKAKASDEGIFDNAASGNFSRQEYLSLPPDYQIVKNLLHKNVINNFIKMYTCMFK